MLYVQIPKGDYKTADKGQALRCHIGSNDGHLYFFKKFLFFIKKPVHLIPHDDIKNVEFKVGQGAKRFEFHVRLHGPRLTFHPVLLMDENGNILCAL